VKFLGYILAIIILASCGSPREVMMPYRNYSLTANRLLPLQYSNDKKSIRIWISESTSLDRVITVSKSLDSSYSGELTIFGPGIGNAQKTKGYFITKKMVPESGYKNFFSEIDSLNLGSLSDQKNIEVVSDRPVEICIIVYLDNGNYTKFRFQSGLSYSDYKVIEALIQKEFPILSTSN
jgi:hypothetical protein